ncbi:hypothetical protein [Enemella dayhoffiae]|uniref:hypothetical protein n=1 Tax=Enemella dayhoffiae TaxID=2016507 RepID=UPI00113FD4D8|nr:hypothetical protein [Enemella dayhoffiae]
MTSPARRAAGPAPHSPVREPRNPEHAPANARRAWREETEAATGPRRAAEPPTDPTPRRAAAAIPASRPGVRPWRTGLLAGSLALVVTATAAAAPDALSSLTPADRPAVQERAAALPLATPQAAAPDDQPVGDRPDRGATRPPVPAAVPPAAVPPPPAPAVVAPPVPRVAGIPNPCPIDLPITDAMSAATITDRAEKRWGLTLTGSQWRSSEYRPVVKLFAETLDAVDCTDYLARVKAGNGGRLEINSGSTRSWAWGDYGLTRPNVLTLDFSKFKQGYAEGDRGRLVRLIIHEMAHSLNTDRDASPAYWNRFQGVWAGNGPVSHYGSTPTESFADAVGYYVARCAADNPYATTRHRDYYEYVKANIFGGREFGTAVGTRQSCDGEGR